MNEEQIVSDIIKLTIGAVLATIGSKIRRFYNNTESHKCAFKHPQIIEAAQYREVKFSKRFNKTYKSDCPWFDLGKIKGFENHKHPYCPFGQNVQEVENRSVGVCPFSNVKL